VPPDLGKPRRPYRRCKEATRAFSAASPSPRITELRNLRALNLGSVASFSISSCSVVFPGGLKNRSGRESRGDVGIVT